jgi:AraC-like DNA-binding protein
MVSTQTYVERPPVSALAPVVSSVWIQQIPAGTEPYTQRNVPNGSVDLLCPVGAVPQVIGPLTGPLVQLLEPGTSLVGVRIRPGAAETVLGVPAAALVDLTVDLDELWGAEALELGEAVSTAATPLAAVQRHLVARSAGAGGPDPLISEAVRQLRWRTEDVGALTSTLHISERQLRRRFQTATGFAPKPLHRMLRFQAFLALAQHAIAHGHAPLDEGIARLAAEAGYADQPHLTRECVRLTGVSPAAFLDQTAASCACGHDHSASFVPLLQARPALA